MKRLALDPQRIGEIAIAAGFCISNAFCVVLVALLLSWGKVENIAIVFVVAILIFACVLTTRATLRRMVAARSEDADRKTRPAYIVTAVFGSLLFGVIGPFMFAWALILWAWRPAEKDATPPPVN